MSPALTIERACVELTVARTDNAATYHGLSRHWGKLGKMIDELRHGSMNLIRHEFQDQYLFPLHVSVSNRY